MLVIATLGFLSGCESILAKYVVATPNMGKSLDKVGRDEKLALPGTVIDHAFRVEIPGDPAADDGGDDGAVSLFVRVIDPSNERVVDTEATPLPLFESTDGRPRHTLPPRGTVLMVHGFYDTMNQVRYLMWARVLAAEGYRVVFADSRGHGRSTGDYATYGVKESGDLRHILNELECRGLLVEPLGIKAVSIGAAAAMRLAERDPRVKAMVFISTFTSMREVVSDYGRAIGFTALSDAAYQRIITKAGEIGGFDPDESNLIDRIASVRVPVLLFCGEADQLISPLHSLRLYEAAGRDDVELIRVRGADHTALGGLVAEPIRGPMVAWFDKYLVTSDE